ncbi:hypothetical protein L6R52_04930 [Myxococcota bacterium]|nr:hypothetical protein [Myxococcota bacterium]
MIPVLVLTVFALRETRSKGQPVECIAQGKACGTIELASGEQIDCGSCGPYEVCGADGMQNVCCAPTSCEEQRVTCGRMTDGCGRVLDCGSCPEGQVCGGGGVANVCALAVSACTPITCDAVDADCGQVSDGCGGVLDCGTCSGGLTCGADGTHNRCGTASSKANTRLVRGCLDVRREPLSPMNHTPVRVGVWAGERAVDFTLEDLHGGRVTLSKLLETAPVVLELGSRTCGVFRHNSPRMDALARRFAGKAHFLTVYTIEAHPLFPDASPYRGRPFPLGFTDVSLARTFDERKSHAKGVELVPERRILVDTLDNPVWCTYGPAPNAAFLIRQDGIIEASHAWLDVDSFAGSLELLLARASR